MPSVEWDGQEPLEPRPVSPDVAADLEWIRQKLAALDDVSPREALQELAEQARHEQG